jgi:hypothetical protein
MSGFWLECPGIKYADCWSVDRRTQVDMTTKRSSNKTRAILKAIAEGNSIEQILGRYSTLNYHDIFRAAAQAPASHWRRKGARAATMGWLECAWAGQDARIAPQTVLHAWSD